ERIARPASVRRWNISAGSTGCAPSTDRSPGLASRSNTTTWRSECSPLSFVTTCTGWRCSPTRWRWCRSSPPSRRTHACIARAGKRPARSLGEMASYYTALSLHVLGATVWAGGHLTLALTILPKALRDERAAAVSEFEQRFERIGLPALAIQ